MATLATYRLAVRRLLHDATGKFYPDADLNDYINAARLQLCKDTGCMRALFTNLTLTAGQEAYQFSGVDSSVLDIWNITIIFGNIRYRIVPCSWTELSSRMRQFVALTQMPVRWAKYGEASFYVGPPPDQAYPTEIDCTTYPGDLNTDADVDPLPLIFQSPIKYYAAYEAKQFAQDFKEAEAFKMSYITQKIAARRASKLREIVYADDIGTFR